MNPKEVKSMTDPEKIIKISRREKDSEISKTTGKPFIILLLLSIISVVQMFRFGMSDRYFLLIGGSFLTIVSLIIYGNSDFYVRKSGSQIIRPVLMIVGFIPYVFGCYLFFYEGIWRMRLLLNGFSLTTLSVSLCYFFSGYVVVMAIYKISEFVRLIDEGRIKIDD